ncbi:hypothetical protein D3C80_1448920 [compost metagenome]
MLALVVVIDFGIAADALCDGLQSFGRNRQGGQGAGAGQPMFEYRADAGERATFMQPLKAAQDFLLFAANCLGDHAIRFRADRQLLLEPIEELAAEGVEFHGHSPYRPMRWARLLKKMPLGLCAGRLDICSRR